MNQNAEITRMCGGYRLVVGTILSYRDMQRPSSLSGIQLWAQAVRDASNFDPEVITWKGWPDLNAEIREYSAAGGKLLKE